MTATQRIDRAGEWNITDDMHGQHSGFSKRRPNDGERAQIEEVDTKLEVHG